MIQATLRLKIVSVANLRLHWSARARMAKAHRSVARHMMEQAGTPPSPPATIVLTRVAPRELDGDNLQSAFKAVRDGVADWLGLDDGDRRLNWLYRQRKGPAKTYLAEVEVTNDDE